MTVIGSIAAAYTKSTNDIGIPTGLNWTLSVGVPVYGEAEAKEVLRPLTAAWEDGKQSAAERVITAPAPPEVTERDDARRRLKECEGQVAEQKKRQESADRAARSAVKQGADPSGFEAESEAAAAAVRKWENRRAALKELTQETDRAASVAVKDTRHTIRQDIRREAETELRRIENELSAAVVDKLATIYRLRGVLSVVGDQ